MLYNSRRIHMEKFNKKVDYYLDTLNMENKVANLANARSEALFKDIGNMFTCMFQKEISAVEGPTRSLTYSQKKVEMSNSLLYWKLRVKYLQGRNINI